MQRIGIARCAIAQIPAIHLIQWLLILTPHQDTLAIRVLPQLFILASLLSKNTLSLSFPLQPVSLSPPPLSQPPRFRQPHRHRNQHTQLRPISKIEAKTSTHHLKPPLLEYSSLS